MENYNLKAGELLELAEGEYEDYFVFIKRVVLKDFNIQDEAKSYIEECGDTINLYGFIEQLDDKGFTKEIEVHNFYVSNGYVDNHQDFDWFGNFSEEEVKEHVDAYYNDEGEIVEDEEEN